MASSHTKCKICDKEQALRIGPFVDLVLDGKLNLKTRFIKAAQPQGKKLLSF